MEMHLSEEQAGFRRDRSTVHQILILRLIAETAKRKGMNIINCFIDFQKAFDLIMMLSGQLTGHMELEREWLKFCRISAEDCSQQGELAENWETGSELRSEHDKEIRYHRQLSSHILKE